MPIRTVITRRSNHFRVSVPSLKNGHPTPCESILEGMMARFLEVSPLVKSYEVQPSHEFLMVQGEKYRYTPDFIVRLINGSEAWVEVKPAECLLVHHIAALINAAKQHFQSSGRCFHVVTDEWLMAEPRAGNIEKLMYHRRGLMNPIDFAKCSSILVRHQPTTLSELCSLFETPEAWKMLGLGVVGVDLDLDITPESSVFMTGGHRHANFFA